MLNIKFIQVSAELKFYYKAPLAIRTFKNANLKNSS
ncbi:MAG: hypothetical protein ACI9CO_001596 [Candidatus Azotimanducaceae bacterium]|jgi:hypothetical protein